MSGVWLIVAMGIGVYALRLSGLVMRDLAIPPAGERALGFVPVALLTALVVSSLGVQAQDGAARLVAIAGAALVAHRTGRMWACILGGMALYTLLRLA